MSDSAFAATPGSSHGAQQQQPGPILRLRLRGPGVARVITLGMYPATLGSAKGCSVRVPLDGVAATHLRLDCRDGREIVAVNLADGKERPAQLNGEKIATPAPLGDRDLLRLGPLELQAFLPARTRGPMVGSPKIREEARAGLLLEGLEEPIAGRLVRLPSEIDVPMTIGRAKHAALSLAHPRVSGEHAVILLRANGTHVVIDQGSRNGTTLNGRPVEPEEPTPLAAGDLLEVGPIAMLVKTAREVPRTIMGTIEAGQFVPRDSTDAPPQKASSTEPQGALPQQVKEKFGEALDEVEHAQPAKAAPRDAELVEPPPGQRRRRKPRDTPQPPAPKRPASSHHAKHERRDGPVAEAGESEGHLTQPVPPPDPEVAARAAKRFPGEPVRGPMLLKLAGADKGEGNEEVPERVALPMRTMLVGRAASADLVLAVPSISSAHCQLEPIGQGREFVLRDADSANGVWVNEVQVQRHVLRHLDVIRFGPIKYLYVAPGRPFPAQRGASVSEEFDTRRHRPQAKSGASGRRGAAPVAAPSHRAPRRTDAQQDGASAAHLANEAAASERAPATWRPLPLVLLELVSIAVAFVLLAVLGLAYAELLPPVEESWQLLLEALQRYQ